MKMNQKPTAESRLVSRLKDLEMPAERPPDRELRRLRGLSAEVGAACTAWLTARGIKTRSWGSFELKPRSRTTPTEFELHPDDNR
jgi:hypothetical protein